MDDLRDIKTYIEKVEVELKDKRFIYNKEDILENLRELLFKPIKEIKGKIGIGFSGGVDSSLLALICSKLNKDFKLYSIGLENSSDLEFARKVAFENKWGLEVRELKLEEAGKVIKKVVNVLKSDDVVKVGVGCVVYSVLEMAEKDNLKVILNGLGSEEIFAGYERHLGYKNDFSKVQERCFDGLKSIWERDLSRDFIIKKNFKVDVVYPFLDKDLIKYSMQIDPKLKVDEYNKKIILRELAFSLGLKKEFAFRKKVAAQYGSKFDRAIFRLMRKNKFKYKKDYLRSLIKV